MENKWYKLPWYEWIGWLLWLVVTIIFLQSAITSKEELATKAATISWIIVAVLIAFAAIIWGMRISRSKQKQQQQ